MEAVHRFLDGTGQVVFQIAQLDIRRATLVRADLNEVLEVQHFGLVTVTDENVEVGVEDRGLVAARHLERRRADAVDLVGLGLRVGILGGINDFQLHLTA